ncbi:hypothetical protein OIU85_026343 [Salix viminalis]|uniref:Endonuclease/exonuclease/phosphatase domain-containing protein n=1 Tax=Salix viminalis TaxID=40686 RepID=A0A9Q0TNB1_SALVM|nr:hypothetical protein OIU85_026343 [Salix viminalis]
MDDFPTCITQSELIHIQATRLQFTWLNDQKVTAIILKRLDWAFGNQKLLMKWPLIRTTVQPRSVSDHSPILLGLTPSPLAEKHNLNFSILGSPKKATRKQFKRLDTRRFMGIPLVG